MNRHGRYGVAAVLLSTMLLACDILGSEGRVSLSVDRETYTQDDTINLTISNSTNRKVDYAVPYCAGAATEIWEASHWVGVPHLVDGIPCFGPGLEVPLDSGDSVVEEYPIEGWLAQPGRYRFTRSVRVRVGAEPSLVISNEFEVEW